ncbi:MAG: fumarate reductase (quinol) flavoprotein subunit [Geminicoccaceae bacterium]|nr:MAG: fumarate reductase (quinol) flavoprotein subunit [Geminicoccaceae bacterium]
MQVVETDIAVIGAGGAGLRAAIAVAETDPGLQVSVVSKVLPMRSHTVAAEGGAAGVVRDNDSLAAHFDDTVSGGDWLCDQDAVELFVEEAPRQLVRLEHWGCPWSRTPEGKPDTRPFGGMKIERTWFAADKSGFHILHTLFQTSLQFPSIKRYDEFFSTDLLVDDGRVAGVVAIEVRTGEIYVFKAKAVIVASGGGGRIFPFTTNGAIKTGDGMAMAYRAGVPLKDMEFVQYHPTGLPGTGILLTEGCRGEGGYLVNKDGHRYLQDYGLGPATPEPRNKAMELGPRDRLSQAFWHEDQKGNTIQTPYGSAVHLDLRHLGEAKINERLPFVRDLATSYMLADPVKVPVPVRPVVHYMMGGIHTDIDAKTPIAGLYAAGECAAVSINGANRLGSNSLTELLVFGDRAGRHAAQFARDAGKADNTQRVDAQAKDHVQKIEALFGREERKEKTAELRRTMANALEEGCGIYRDEARIQATCETIADVRRRTAGLALQDRSKIFNTDLLSILELENMLEIAEAVAHSALQRKESRGSHQRLDHTARDDTNFLKHSMAHYQGTQTPTVDYLDVVITKSPPGERLYGGAAEAKAKKMEAAE